MSLATKKLLTRFCFCVLMACQTTCLASAQDGALPKAKKSDEVQKKEKKDEESKLATVAVKMKPVIVYESFDGVFESTRMKEVKAHFDSWTDLKIEEVIEEGAAVTAGQELIQFDKTTIEKAIKEAEFAVQNSQFELETARLSQKEAQTTFDLDMAQAERTWENARSDYEYYRTVELPDRIDDLAYSEKSAGYFLEYSRDELDQLEQMYTEDELTEESEEIVLKRARRSVESAERSKKRTLRRVNRDRETNIPREQLSKEEGMKRSELAYKRKMITLPIANQKSNIALAQAEFNHANKLKKLEELKADYQKMTLSAPADGIVYYGKCLRGKWVGGSGSAKRRLEPEKKVTANTVVMTIVDVGQQMIRASLDQSAMGALTSSLRGKAKLKANNMVVAATIKSISRIPMDDGTYDCQALVDNIPNDGSVMPGMSCKLSFLVYENKQALVVPKSSVFSDDEGVTHYVFVGDGETATRKPVVVGHTSGDHIEIHEGLSDGDKIAKTRQ